MLFSTELNQEKLTLLNFQNESNEDADDGIITGGDEDKEDDVEEMIEEEVKEDDTNSDSW